MSSKFELQPTMTGELVHLRPLHESDFESMFECASDPLIWEIHPEPTRYKKEVFAKFFKGGMDSGGALAVTDRATGKIIGSSRFYDPDPADDLINIGYTFIARKYWGGGYNRELKFLMLQHAFRFVASVLFQIGEKNFRSQKAIGKIGAKLCDRKTLDGNPHLIYKIERPEFTRAFVDFFD